MKALICLSVLLVTVGFRINEPIVDLSQLIEWESNTPLEWKDFKGKPDKSSPYFAVTYTSIAFSVEKQTPSGLELKVSNHFAANNSWTKDRESKSLLKHEQLHFDLSELAARRLRMEYKQLPFVSIKKAEPKIKQLFSKYATTYKDSLNRTYDRETKHGVVEAKQTQWEEFVKEELKKTAAFSSAEVVIGELE